MKTIVNGELDLPNQHTIWLNQLEDAHECQDNPDMLHAIKTRMESQTQNNETGMETQEMTNQLIRENLNELYCRRSDELKSLWRQIRLKY